MEQMRVNGTGGLRQIDPTSTTIPEGLAGYLEERNRANGSTETEKEWVDRTSYGNTLADYQEHKEKMAKSNGGAS